MTDSPSQPLSRDLTKELMTLESSILTSVTNLQKYRKRIDCFYYQNQGEQPQFNDKTNYYAEFWKTFIINQFMVNQLKELTDNVGQFTQEVKKLEELEEEYVEVYKQKNKKKNRRLSSEIPKEFNCPYANCYKVYGTDVSLNLHMKIKHNGGNKTEREALARQYVKAVKLGQEVPEIKIVFPPAYLDSFMEEFERTREEKN